MVSGGGSRSSGGEGTGGLLPRSRDSNDDCSEGTPIEIRLGRNGSHLKSRMALLLNATLPSGATRAVNAVKIPSAGDPTALAHAAIRGLPRITAAVGHPTSPVRIPPRCTHKGGGFPLFLVPVAVLVIGGLLVQLVLQWRRHAEPPTTP